MAFIRKIKKKNGIYLAEVENKWINGKVVQKHIRYIGKLPESRSSFLEKDDKNLTRIDILKELDLGKSKQDIAKLYDVSVKTVLNIKERFENEGVKGLIQTRKNNYETVKVSTPEQAAIITDIVQHPDKSAKEIKDTTANKSSLSDIKKIITPITKYLKLKKKILLDLR